MANLNLLVGPPASGKSTWVNKNKFEDYIVSRDKIRFILLKPGDDYFKYEKEVYFKFIQAIDYYGALGDKDVWVDQTNISRGARAKLLNNIQKDFYNNINAYVFEVPFDELIERNAARIGRAKVPESAIENMYKSFETPTLDEGFDNIYKIDVFDNIYNIERRENKI